MIKNVIDMPMHIYTEHLQVFCFELWNRHILFVFYLQTDNIMSAAGTPKASG
jgi:hypothetical protein